MEPITLATIAKKFSDEESAWEFMEQVRWAGHPVCPHCGSEDVKFYPPKAQRVTRTGKLTYRRVWGCRECKRQFSAIVGTIFEGSKVPLGKWLMALHLFCSGKNGASAHEIHRDLGVTYKTAWYLIHRIRESMAAAPAGSPLKGLVVVDETYIGGKPANRHADKRSSLRRQGVTDKTPVLSIVHPESGEVRSTVLPDTTLPSVQGAIKDNVDLPSTTLHTDEAPHYTGIGRQMAGHGTVLHKAGQYVNDGVTTNKAENFFSQLKRSLDGTYHCVSVEHLERYTGEFDFRAGTRRLSDGERTAKAIQRSDGRYLSYADLIARGPVAQGTRRRPPGRPGPRLAGPSALPRGSTGTD